MSSTPFNFSQCPPPPQPTPQEANDALTKVIESSGIQSCRTDNTQASLQAKASMLGLASAGVSMSFNNTSTVGCEQIVATSKKYQQTQQNVSCMIKQSQNVNSTTLNNVNSIIFKAGNNLNVDCLSGINISQGASVRFIQAIKFNSQEINQIAQQTKGIVQDLIANKSSSTTEAGATPQGQKTFTDINNKIDAIDFNQSVSQSVNEVNTSVNTQNKILLEAGNNLTIKGSQCNFKQDILVDLIASTIVDNAVENALRQIGEFVNETDSQNVQTSENKGPDMGKSFWENFDNSTKYLIIGIVAIVLIIVIGIIVKLAFGSKKPTPSEKIFKHLLRKY